MKSKRFLCMLLEITKINGTQANATDEVFLLQLLGQESDFLKSSKKCVCEMRSCNFKVKQILLILQ